MSIVRHNPIAVRAETDDDRVAWLELFFDLIYVAALVQLGSQLSAELSWAGAGRFAALFVVLWWTWTGTTVHINRVRVDDIVHRLLVVAQMFTVGILALVAIGEPSVRDLWLPVTYAAAQAVLVAMYLRAAVALDQARRTWLGFAAIYGTGATLWLASLVLATPLRYWVWGLAVVIELIAPIVLTRRVDAPPTNEEHFRERYALFTIIVIGEAFLKTLTELAGRELTPDVVVLSAVTFVITVALWWTYFDDIADAPITDDHLGRLTRWVPVRAVWIYAHLPLTLAITAFGVATTKVVGVDGLDAVLGAPEVRLLVASVVLTLLAVVAIEVATTRPHFAVPLALQLGLRLAAAVAVLVVGWAGAGWTVLTLASAIAAIVVVQLAVEMAMARVADGDVAAEVERQVEGSAGTCEHLEAAEPRPLEGDRCAECVAQGTSWSQLRMCATCGAVGCCDDSSERHARAHHEESGHPVVVTLEPGERWAACLVDDVIAPEWPAGVADESAIRG